MMIRSATFRRIIGRPLSSNSHFHFSHSDCFVTAVVCRCRMISVCLRIRTQHYPQHYLDIQIRQFFEGTASNISGRCSISLLTASRGRYTCIVCRLSQTELRKSTWGTRAQFRCRSLARIAEVLEDWFDIISFPHIGCARESVVDFLTL